MKKIFLLIFVCCSLTAFSQTNKTFQIGLGSSFLGSGDILAGVLEVELGYKLNPYFSTTFGLNSALGYENIELRETTSYQQGNANIYLSPFQNNRKVDFKIGTGISANYIVERRMDFLSSIAPAPYISESRFSVGINMIVETTFVLQNNFLLGFKGFIQPYISGDINSGILVKIGKAF